jgi:septal ring factor EnvC (AmiA/AmiB activator)
LKGRQKIKQNNMNKTAYLLVIILTMVFLAIALLNAENLVGNDSDSHGCKASAGYTWCEQLQKCIRPWQTKCEAAEIRTDIEDLKEQLKDKKKEIKNITEEIKSQIKDLRTEIKDLEKKKNKSVWIDIEDKNISIKALDDDKLELIAGKISAKTGLNITAEQVANASILEYLHSNGKTSEIKIMPNTASERALERLRLKVCNETNNCTLLLKEVGNGNQTKLAYELSLDAEGKSFLFFKNKRVIQAQVDAEDGTIISVNKPWWFALKQN